MVVARRDRRSAKSVQLPCEPVTCLFVDEVRRVQPAVVAAVGDDGAASADQGVLKLPVEAEQIHNTTVWLILPYVDTECGVASGQGEARLGVEAGRGAVDGPGGPGALSLLERGIGFDGLEVFERIAKDLAQVRVGLGDQLAACVIGCFNCCGFGGGAGFLGVVGAESACDGFLHRAACSTARRSRSRTARAS